MNKAERKQMIESNLPLVGYLVRQQLTATTGFPAEDLVQAGSLALVQAVDAYDAERGVPFGAFARERINGAIKDELRRGDWAKRTTRQQINRTLEVKDSLAAELGRAPSATEVAGALGVDRKAAEEGLAFASRVTVSLSTAVADFVASEDELPEEDVLLRERLNYLNAAIAALPERMRIIIEAIYLHERTVGEVAEELGVTHSAVSQQRAEAVRLLRVGLSVHYGDDGHPGEHELAGTSRGSKFLRAFAERLSASPSTMAAAVL